MIITDHFRQRVRERIGDVDADAIGHGILWAIRNDRKDLVQFVGRVSRCGKRIFRFRVVDGRQFFALVDTERGVAITVLPPGFKTNRQSKAALMMTEVDW